MKIDVGILVPNLLDIPNLARVAEEVGFDCLWTSETQHDPFLPLALAACATHSLLVVRPCYLALRRAQRALNRPSRVV